MPQRLTRRETQAQTREALIQAAKKVFLEKGMAGSSINEIAKAAGFTKGAFNANFSSKDELFLELLARQFVDIFEALSKAANEYDDGHLKEQLDATDFLGLLKREPEWIALNLEFGAYAARNDDFRQRLVAEHHKMRAALAELIAYKAEALGAKLRLPAVEIASMCISAAQGHAVVELLDPTGTPTNQLNMMIAFLAGSSMDFAG